MKSTIINIKTDSQQVFEDIVGSIKKIFILTTKPMYHVSLTFRTNEREILYKLKLEQPMTIIYPWNFIDLQGRGVEYYSHGDIFLDVEGLLDGEEINQVSIFYQ